MGVNTITLLRISWLIILFLGINISLQAQALVDSLRTQPEIAIFGTLYHQHHDFFAEAFSYQGIEAGVIVHRKLFLGAYGSFFASNLKFELNDTPTYGWMGQIGVNAGYVIYESKWVHPGCQLDAGRFTLRTDDHNFSIFETRKAAFSLNGYVLSPQVFGEFNLAQWCKIRTGLSYNFYYYKDHSTVQTADLNHLSFTFGIVFCGK